MTVRISRVLLEKLIAQGAAAPDREICGLLLGDAARIEAVVAAANVSANPADSFEIDPGAIFAQLRGERGGGPCWIGHYHSHPDGSAAPSPRDAAAAAGTPATLWLILGGGIARLWRSGAVEGLHGCFEGVELVADAGSAVA